MPYLARLNSAVMLLLLSNWLLINPFKKGFRAIIKDKSFYVLISYYLLCAIGLLYTSNLETGYGILLKRVSLFLLPLIFAPFQYNPKILKYISFSFIFSIGAAATYTLLAVYNQHKTYLADYTSDKLRDVLIQPTGLHPTYFAMYVLFAVFLLLFIFIQHKWYTKIFPSIAIILFSLYLLGFTLLLSARMPLISFGVLVIFLSVFILLKNKYYGIFITGLILVAITFYIIISSALFSQRFLEVSNTEWKPPVGIHYNSTNLRIGIFTCTYQNYKQNWLLGTGTGDMQDKLNQCYEANGYSEVMYKNRYNTHSIYLDALLMLGLIGLLLLLYNFYYYLRVAYKYQMWMYMVFLLLFLLCGISESFFNTQKGIVFFSFFNTLFLYYTHQTSNKANV